MPVQGRMTAGADDDGKRLDAALLKLLPCMGLRGRRRLCLNGLVFVDGSAVPPSHTVRAGQAIEVIAVRQRADDAVRGVGCVIESGPAALLHAAEHLALLRKPAGMHTAALNGGTGASLEFFLPGLLPGHPRACLLNRLDAPTSGIVVAALDEKGSDMYHDAQQLGKTEKRYLALLQGALKKPIAARQRIAQDKRRRVKVLDKEDADPLRHTHIFPIAVLDADAVWRVIMPAKSPKAGGREERACTLAGCLICKGARHQIRAHAAFYGFPLAGDVRYGAETLFSDPLPDAGECFFLHHARFSMPGIDARDLPRWLDALRSAGIISEKAVADWLERPCKIWG